MQMDFVKLQEVPISFLDFDLKMENIQMYMKTSLFDYDLPPERIAQAPISIRDQSRLLTLWNGICEERIFYTITDLFRPDDILVINDTRVMPARIR